MGQHSIEQHDQPGGRTVGVDAAAHTGALDAGGRTVVVLGCGLDVTYPRANAALLARVRAAGGTMVSEHPPGARPRAANFLPRNRLIVHSLGEFGSGPRTSFHSCWPDATASGVASAPQLSRTSGFSV
jgi:hypothetical protein